MNRIEAIKAPEIVAGLTVRWLRTLAEIEAAEAQWRHFDAHSTADFVWFQSFDWCRSWVARQADRRTEPRVLMLMAGAEVRAIVPFMVTRNRFGVRLLTILGAPHTQYANVITPSGTLSAEAIQLMRSAIKTEGEVDALLIDLVPIASPLAHLLGNNAAGAQASNEAALLDLSRFETAADFEATLSKHATKELRRRRRLMNETLGDIDFVALRPGMPGYEAAISACVATKKLWITNTGRISRGLSFRDHDQFLASVSVLGENDGPIVWALRTSDRLLATEIGFLQRGHYYCYMASFDWSWRHLAPGKLQKSMTIDSLIRKGVQTFDLMANPTDYKKEYSSFQVPLCESIVTYTLKGKIYIQIWERKLFPILRDTFNSLPGGLRQRIARARQVNLSSAHL